MSIRVILYLFKIHTVGDPLAAKFGVVLEVLGVPLELKSEELTGGERPLLPFFPLFLSSTVKTLVTVGKVL